MRTVLHVIPSLGPHGHAQQLATLAPFLNDAGSRHIVIQHSDVSFWRSPLEQADIPVFVLGPSTPFLPYLWLALRRLIIQQRPDIIQAWGWHSLCVATTATVRKNIPLVAVDTALPRRSSFMQRWLFRQARRVALPVGSVDSRTAVIPWCVAPPAPSDRRTMRESLELPADSPTVLIADPIKIGFGWRESLQVFDILSHVYPNIRLLVASDGPEFGSMQEFAGKLGLRSVHYLGWRHDLTAVIEASDAVLILGDRGGRNLALQSLASGAAIVACDRPDLRALLADTAVFVAAGDMHGAAVAARQAIDNPRGAELVQRQRELAASYSPDRIAQVWSNLYDSISTSSHVTA